MNPILTRLLERNRHEQAKTPNLRDNLKPSFPIRHRLSGQFGQTLGMIQDLIPADDL